MDILVYLLYHKNRSQFVNKRKEEKMLYGSRGEAVGTTIGLGMILLWVFLAGLHYINPVLPVVFLTIFWGVTLGLVIGLGGQVKLVLVQCFIWPIMLGYIGYELAGWAGAYIALLQFANILDFAFMVGIVVWISSSKIKKELTAQTQ